MEDLNRDLLKTEMRTIWTIWAAFFHALLAYVLVCHYLEEEVPFLKEYDLPLEFLKYSFFALSLIVLFLCHRVRKNMFEHSSIKSDLKIVERANKKGKPAIVVKYFAILMITVAFAESICLLGVVYFFLSRDFLTLYSLVAISAVTMLFYRPKLKELLSITLHPEATIPSLRKMGASGWH